MPKVDADAKIKPEKGKMDDDNQKIDEAAEEDGSDSESESEGAAEGEEPKKKRPKEKVGFRDRKVIAGLH